jgi:hypothetical protein
MTGRIGVGQGSVLAANIYEMAVISITAMLAVIVLLFTGGLNDPDAVIGFFRRDIGSTVIIAVIILTLSAVAVIYCRKKSPAFLTVSMARMSLGALPAYLVFFAVSSLILTGLLGFYSNDVRPLLSFHTVLGVFSLSWIAGFLAPGAPGGLGVRETVIVLMLGSAVGEGPALGAALLLRMVTAAGDVLSFVYSFFLEKKEGR